MSGVGAIVPAHGDVPFLAATLDSILAQDPSPDEIVVVDDGSPIPIVLAERHASRCRLIRREQRGGPAPARGTALEALESDLVALADADDVWAPGKLAAQLERLDAEPDAAVCFGSIAVVDRDGRETGERWDWDRPDDLDPRRFARLLYEHNPIHNSTTVLRRAPLEAAGGFDSPAPLAEDYDLWLRLAARGERFVHEPLAGVVVRRHERSLSWDIAALAESLLVVRAAHAGLVDDDLVRRMRASDLRALAQGRVRHRDYAGAREALAEAAKLEPLPARLRALDTAMRVPGLREVLGRRYPYR